MEAATSVVDHGKMRDGAKNIILELNELINKLQGKAHFVEEIEITNKLFEAKSRGDLKREDKDKFSKLEFSKGIYYAKFPGIRGNEGE